MIAAINTGNSTAWNGGFLVILAAAGVFAWSSPAGFCDEPAQRPKRIHVFVALCDNDTQAIAPVNDRIGDGDDPENNLYWGCSDGLPKYFAKRKQWSLIRTERDVTADILRRVIFRHKQTRALLVADAYRGSSIRICLGDFLYSAAGQQKVPVCLGAPEEGGRLSMFGGGADLVAYIGHNGLMEHSVSEPDKIDGSRTRDAIVLSCVSDRYFRELLRRNGARPVLTTQQFMYPGAFALHAALEGWLRKESLPQLRTRAGKAMAINQKISVKAATRIFAELD